MKNLFLNKQIKATLLGLMLFALATILVQGYYLFLVALVLTTGTLLILYSLRIVLKNTISSIFISSIVIVFLSLIDRSYQLWFCLSLLIIAISFIILRRKSFLDYLSSDYLKFKSIKLIDIAAWVFLFMLIIFLGMANQNGFFTFDANHPVYELSIGNSYGKSLLNSPDLSYSGKYIRFHFLSTQIPSLLANVFHIEILQSVYYLTPLFFLFLSFILISSFFSRYQNNRLPVFILFFSPLLIYNTYLYIPLTNVTIFAPSSYFLGFLLSVISIYYLLEKRFIFLIACWSLLILVKAPFFLTIFGGAVLYFLRKKQYNYILKIIVPQLAIFVILYLLFLAGSHIHNVWLIFPTIIWEIINLVIVIQQSFTLLGVLGLVAFIGMFALIFACVISTYKKSKDNNLLLLLSSISFSGLIGIFFLVEVSEGNSYQFYYGALFPTIIVLWNWLKDQDAFKIKSLMIGSVILLIISTVSTTSLAAKNLVKWYSDTYHEYGIVSSLYTKATGKNIKQPNFPVDLIDAYTWLGKNTSEEGVVLLGKHYEWLGDGAQYQIDTKFLRSGLSKMQMFCENYQYKGIGMQTDFSSRFSNTLIFYKNFVSSSEHSKNNLNYFYNESYGKEVAVPLSKDNKVIHKMIYYLSFHKEWIWVNISVRIPHEIKEGLNKHKYVDQNWALSFIDSSDIRYIALENSDQPTEFLEAIADKIYANRSVTIFEVHKAHLKTLMKQFSGLKDSI